MILGSARVPIVLLDGSSGAIEILLWGLAGAAALAFSWFVGLLLSFGVALDVKARVGLEILCVVLATIHVAAGIKLQEMFDSGLGLVLPARISLIVGALVLSGVIIGRVRRWRRRSRASDTQK
jgi:hypothetical protein